MPCPSAKPYDAQALQRAQLPTCNFREAGVKLVIQGNRARCYRLDGGYFRPQDCLCPSSPKGNRRCDGVILGCINERCYVIFFDLKKGKDEDVVRQLEDTLCYFCRCQEEGLKHHQNWSPQKPWQGHEVVALVMNEKPSKEVSRWCGNKLVKWRSIGRRRQWPSFEAFLNDIGPL